MTSALPYEFRRVVHDIELNRLVSEIYQRPYNLQQQEFLGQDTVILVTVPEEPDEGMQESFDMWRAMDAAPRPDDAYPWVNKFRWERCEDGVPKPPIQCVMNDLHTRGLIDEGKYAIHIWW